MSKEFALCIHEQRGNGQIWLGKQQMYALTMLPMLCLHSISEHIVGHRLDVHVWHEYESHPSLKSFTAHQHATKQSTLSSFSLLSLLAN
jgi:hypothetical protein